MPKGDHPRGILTTHEARRALFVDFEGRMQEPPAFVGVAWDVGSEPRLRQVVLDIRLTGAASAKALETLELRAFIAELATWARSEDRVLVAWSERELRVFDDQASTPLDRTTLRNRYRNGVKLAGDWRRHHTRRTGTSTSPLPADNSLASFMEHFGYEVRQGRGPGNVAKAIKDVREGLQRRDGEYTSLTSVMKSKWTRAIGHNEDDCLGMRFVCRKMIGLD
jgi:hypothetical protein